MNRWTQRMLIALVAIGAATAGVVTGAAKLSAPPDEAAGKELLALNLSDAQGKAMPFDQWKGKVLVVNFWATWCPPCREEMPAFDRVSLKYAAKGVQFVGISIDTPDKVRDFAEELMVSYPLLIGGYDTLQIAAKLGNTSQALPFTVIYDRQGTARLIKLGTLSEADLEAAIKPLL